MEPAVEFRHVSMEFPGVLANDDISLSIRQGEVFALVGENGAGKTTLMNLLYGIHTPTDGEIYLRGERITNHSPRQAIARGFERKAFRFFHEAFLLIHGWASVSKA